MAVIYRIQPTDEPILEQFKAQRSALAVVLDPMLEELKQRRTDPRFVKTETERLIVLVHQSYQQIPCIVRDALLQDKRLNRIWVCLANENIEIVIRRA